MKIFRLSDGHIRSSPAIHTPFIVVLLSSQARKTSRLSLPLCFVLLEPPSAPPSGKRQRYKATSHASKTGNLLGLLLSHEIPRATLLYLLPFLNNTTPLGKMGNTSSTVLENIVQGSNCAPLPTPPLAIIY
jgi:hypothetical protein